MPEIDSLTADAVRELRHAVLYPERPPEDCTFPGDLLEATHHLGMMEGGRLIGILSLFNEPPPNEGGTPGEAGGLQWRIRGVAVLPDHQGCGLGADLVTTALRRVREAGGTRVWCHVRQPAIGFYERLDFTLGHEVQADWTDRRFWLMERRP